MKYLSEAISVDEFWAQFLEPLVPVIFGKWLTHEWEVVEKWSDTHGLANLKYLRNKYGTEKVSVTD